LRKTLSDNLLVVILFGETAATAKTAPGVRCRPRIVAPGAEVLTFLQEANVEEQSHG
jgi:hypothetical protein